MTAPLIGITANRFEAEPRAHYTGKALDVTDAAMVQRVVQAGGVPVVLPIVESPAALERYVALIDGLLLTGGADVDPSSYGQAARGWTGQPERDRFEMALIRHMRAARRAIFGVCRGHQILNVAYGGTLLHDIGTDHAGAGAHRDDDLYDRHQHPLRVSAGSPLAQVLGGTAVTVNSVHHQAVDTLGQDLVAMAWAPDGLIEAVHAPGDHWTWGVQWHPEWDPRAEHADLFRHFVEAACAD